MTIDEEIVAALDMVYAHSAEVPQDVPAGNVLRGPWAFRSYGIAAAVAAAIALILAYPVVTATSTRQAGSGTVSARLDTSLANLRLVTVDAAHTPNIRSVVLDHRRVTAWVARVDRSAKYVYDLDDAQLAEFTASLPPSDSGLTDPCSFMVRFGGAAQTYQTQPTASVPVKLSGTGPVSITVAPTQSAGGLANCAMTDPVVQAAPLHGAVSLAPEPVASQAVASPPPVSPAQQVGASLSVSPSANPAPSTVSSPVPTPSGTAAPAQTAVAAATSTSAALSTAAPATDPPVLPEGGDLPGGAAGGRRLTWRCGPEGPGIPGGAARRAPAYLAVQPGAMPDLR